MRPRSGTALITSPTSSLPALPAQQSFLRVVWPSCRTRPDLTITAIDDAGDIYGPVQIPWRSGPHGCGQIVAFNSHDLERGNPDKGLSPGVGRGSGGWQLFIDSTEDVNVSSYVRTGDGFLTSMHDTVPFDEDRNAYVVQTFNPGRNVNQRSALRLVNPNDISVGMSILGQDDHTVGSYDSGPFILMEARESLTVSAVDLEAGRPEWVYEPLGYEDGNIGDGSNAGKWRLYIRARSLDDPNDWKPLIVMNLMSTPAGHITNLSSAPDLSSQIGLPGQGPVTPPTREFDIELVFDADVPPAVRASVEEATKVWERIVVGDFPDLTRRIPDNFPNGYCRTECQQARTLRIDDFVVFVGIRDYGAARPTASADSCRLRPRSHADGQTVPYAGWLTVNSRYQTNWDHTTAVFDRTMIHELGHVLAFSRNLFDRDEQQHVLDNPRRFIGPNALAEWRRRGAQAFYSLTGVSIPTDSIPLDGQHWDDRLQGEIMTAAICAGSKVTPLTVAVLADLGYTVDMTQAEGYPNLGCVRR